MNGKAIITIKKLNLNEHKARILSDLPIEDTKKCLRQVRNEECFAVTDRPLWYNRLPDYQKADLNDWYEKWLRVTETFDIPIKPYWLEN